MSKNQLNNNLDDVDKTILRYLQEDGRLSNAKLAERLSLSETPCWRRLRRLEAEGYIEDYQANLNRRKLGFGVLAFVQLSMSNHTDESNSRFEEAIQACPEVLFCHNITGQSDYLLQIVATDLDAYALFINQVLRKMPGVNTMHSSLSLREIKSLSRLPLS